MPHVPGEPQPVTPVWRHLLLVGVLLVVLGVLAFDLSHALVVMRPRVAAPALWDAGLALVWALAAFFLVGRGRAALVRTRDHGPATDRRRWDLVLNGFAALGYLYLLVVALGLLRLNLGGLLIGGAVTGVVIGIAAQSALGNLFGGMLVLLLHPYGAGERIMIRSGNFGGTEYTGTVHEVTLFYTTLDTTGGVVLVPNSLAAACVVRVEGSDDTETVTAPVPYGISPEELGRRLRHADLDPDIRVEAFSDVGYTVRLRIPAHGADRVVSVLASLRTEPSGQTDPVGT